MLSSSSSSDTCVVVVDNGDDRRRRCRPADKRAVELAKAIHRDDDKSKSPATAVNQLDSAKHAYRRRLEGGGWWNNATATDDDGDDSGVVKER